MVDPNPKVAGQGIKRLIEAGIQVDVGILETQAQLLNEVFLKHILTGRPFVAMKTAMTLDGKIACESGDSKWITNEKSRAYVHKLRNTYAAILVGIGTVLKDDPMLNTRLEQEDIHHPVRVIIDSHLELPLESQIVQSAKEQRTIVFCSGRVDQQQIHLLKSQGIEVISLDDVNGFLPLEKVFESLYKIGICSVLVEGGGEINGYLIQHQLFDKLYWFIAPKLIGGRKSRSPIGGEGIQQMKDACLLNYMEIQRFDEDVLFTAYPINK
jgi:diaminohydroxyphosphoribosylaminopyrimidine deaminase/5-amino-6-(5-phosphoribosylamino)uracil reductase